MTTIKDIAKQANVSIASVSRVINNLDGVGAETRRRILELIEQMDYTPNHIARSLISGKTATIGLILPNISNPFFPEVARGFEDTARKHGYTVILCNTDEDPEKERQYVNVLLEKSIDGLVFITSTYNSIAELEKLIRAKIPFVPVGRHIENYNGPSISINTYTPSREATKYLLQQGYQKIAFISGPLHSETSSIRLKGYMDALKEGGHPINPQWIMEGEFNEHNGYRSANILLKLPERPDAIFCANDVIAYGAMKAILSSGLRIPEDIGIIGFDDIVYSEMMHPSLTTVSQPKYTLGETAAEMLIHFIQNNQLKKKHRVIECNLIVRESTRLLREGSVKKLEKSALTDVQSEFFSKQN